jgi:5'(3')-deoxyribonucleotidase
MATIAVDLDGVCYEWHRTVRYMFNEYKGYNLPPVDSWWDTWWAPKEKGYINAEDVNWLFTEGIDLGLFRYGHVTTGAVVGLRKLVDAGHRLLVATHRPTRAVPDTLAWLHYLDIPWSGVHIISDETSKTIVDADILLDDKTENCMDWAESQRTALLFDRPWNQKCPPSIRIHRVFGWTGVEKGMYLAEHVEDWGYRV